MATKIPLATQTELPPSRVGAAKPGFDLADRSGQIGFGQALAKFGGDTFDRLIQTRAANEEAEFQGNVNKSLADWSAFVAGNPGASYEQLQVERDRMMKDIKSAGQNKSLTGIARQNINNWFAKNEGAILGKSQASMESIRAKQELQKYGILQENNINNLDKPKYIDAKDKMITSGLLNADIAEAQQEHDFEVIESAQQKILVEGVSNTAFGAYEQAIELGLSDSDATKAGLDVIRESEIVPGGEKQELEQDLISSIGYRQALDKQEFDAVAEEQNVAIDKAISEGGDVQSAIDSATNLTTAEKNSWEKAWEKHNKSILKDDIANSPFNQGSQAVFQKWLNAAQTDPKSFNMNQMTELTKIGKGGKAVQALTDLPPNEEDKFQTAYASVAKQLGINPDPDDPKHFYDYRGLFEETGSLGVGPQKHFPSKFKLLGHPNLIVDGKDTRTGAKATQTLIEQNQQAREGGFLEGGITTAQWRTINSTRNTALKSLESGQDPLNSRTAKLGDEYLSTFKADDPEGWLQSVNDYNKWYLDFTEKNQREPSPRESETKLQFLTTDIVRKFWTNDLPDAQIKTELRDIPLEGQKAFVESAQREESTTAWLKKWRAKPKKLTRDIAVHYLGVADGNRDRAIELAKKDGYTE